MKKILYNISLYLSFLKISLKEILIYRIDCIAGIFSQLVVQAVSLIFIFIVFQNTENIVGWSFEQILLLYGVTRISIGISGYCFDELFDIGPRYIRSGEFDKILLRPVHPLISIIGAINTIFSISSFWTYRSNEVIWSFYRMYTFAEYPLDIYNGFIKILITVILPFAFVAYYPTMDYLGLNNYMIYLSPIIAIILWIIAIKLWNLALNKYRSTGT